MASNSTYHTSIMASTESLLPKRLLQPNDFAKTHEQILSDDIYAILVTMGFGAMSSVFCLLGIVTNIINLLIFWKQGLDTTMNISFFALAISDLISLVTLQTSAILTNPWFDDSILTISTSDIQYLISAWPHACFGHITCWITAYITAERCLCIAFPLKIKQIVNPTITTLMICGMYFINIVSAIPEYLSMYLDWGPDPKRNASTITLHFKDNRSEMNLIGFILGALLGGLSFPAVVLFTVILIVKLKQQSKWRNTSTTGGKQTEAITKRDIKTMNMVVLIASILIVCYTPGVVGCLLTAVWPAFNISGSEVKIFRSVWGYIFALDSVNSSVNIFLYYRMSTKYRISFDEMFGIRKSKTSGKEIDAGNDDD